MHALKAWAQQSSAYTVMQLQASCSLVMQLGPRSGPAWGVGACNGKAVGVVHLLERSAPAPPRRKRQLHTSMERSLPTYQFCVMFSWFTISASLLGRACKTKHNISL